MENKQQQRKEQGQTKHSTNKSLISDFPFLTERHTSDKQQLKKMYSCSLK